MRCVIEQEIRFWLLLRRVPCLAGKFTFLTPSILINIFLIPLSSMMPFVLVICKRAAKMKRLDRSDLNRLAASRRDHNYWWIFAKFAMHAFFFSRNFVFRVKRSTFLYHILHELLNFLCLIPKITENHAHQWSPQWDIKCLRAAGMLFFLTIA